MADMDYLTHEQLSVLEQQALTSYDWDFEIDWSRYVGYHPDAKTVHMRTLEITGVDGSIQTEVKTIEMRGFTLLQAGKTQNKPADFTLSFQDFEDQSLKAWFLDWQNKMDSLATHRAYRRSDLMVDFYIYRLDSSLRRVWQWHYFNCLPNTTTYAEAFDGNKEPQGKCSVVITSEYMIPTPLNVA